MKKEHTTNTFSKGLMMDLNPIVTPNDVLVNCLNGTLITYQGNENALQNDMGNGRVNLAYLPEGYVPMGTAEFGGIIYIVSYNPLTDKCQIGSFPSPERNISSSEISDLNVVVNNDQFHRETEKKSGVYYITNGILKVKLFDKQLNPGDKFYIYSTNEGIKTFKDSISDVGTKSSSVDQNPKNVTIHVVSISEDGKITYLDNNLKWNSDLNYYISDLINKNPEKDIDDKRTLASTAYNVFRSKVSGELALLFELKMIDSYSLTWDADVENNTDSTIPYDKVATIYFDTNWTSSHNKINTYALYCNETEGLKSSEKAKFSRTSKESDENVDYKDNGWVYKKAWEGEGKEGRTNDGSDPSIKFEIGKAYYNSEETNEQTLTYNVIPAMSFGNINYLKISNSINLKELGSGIIELFEWRYYIDTTTLRLNWGLNAYPEKGKKIFGIDFKFISFENVEEYFKDTSEFDTYIIYSIRDKNSYAGSYQELFEFGSTSKFTRDTLVKNNLYLVCIDVIYDKSSKSSDDKTLEHRRLYRWLYTTNQWNQEFIDDKISDFNELTLDNVFTLEQKEKVVDSIASSSSDYHPQLLWQTYPDSEYAYPAMGIKVSTVNYEKNKKTIIDNTNVKVTYEIQPSSQTELFKFDDTNIKYTNEISGKEITLSNNDVYRNQPYEDDLDPVASRYIEDLNETTVKDDTITGTIDIAKSVTEGGIESGNDNDDIRDLFNVYLSNDETNTNYLNLGVKGAIFSRISAQIPTTPKEVPFNQTVRPILRTSKDIGDLGFVINSTEKSTKSTYLYGCHTKNLFYSHWFNHAGDPFGFDFMDVDLRNIQDINNTHYVDSDQSGSDKDWGDAPHGGTYWDVANCYTKYLSQWMYATGCPFIIMQYISYETGKGGRPKDCSLQLGTKPMEICSSTTHANDGATYGLWVRLDNDYYIPINAFWQKVQDGSVQSFYEQSTGQNYKVTFHPKTLSEIAYNLMKFLAQVYYVDTDEHKESYYLVDDIFYKKDYTETWKFNVESTIDFKTDITNNTMNYCINLVNDNSKINLGEFYNSLKDKGINLNNLTYHNNDELNLKFSIPVSHTFNLNVQDLQSEYLASKEVLVESMYYLATQTQGIRGKTLNSNYLYVCTDYDTTNPQFTKLTKDTSDNIIIEETRLGKCATMDVFIITFPDNIEKSKKLDICDGLVWKNQKLYFSKDLLVDSSKSQITYRYATDGGFFQTDSNSKFPFYIGEALNYN